MPYPPEGGDRFRVYHLIRTAAEAGHEVHLVTFDSAERTPEEVRPLTRLLASIRVVQMPRILSAFRSAQAIPSHLPLQAAYYRSSRMRQCVKEALRRACPEVIVTHLFRMAPYALERMESHPARWILDLTDVISAGIERSLPYRSGPDLWLYREEMRRIVRFEALIAPQFDECWVISEAERAVLHRIAPAASITVVPNGLATLPAPTIPVTAAAHRVHGSNGTVLTTGRDRARLLFLGFHEVFHNRDAVRFLVQEIVPRVRAAVPDATLDLAGKGSEALGSWARGPGVNVVGYVPRLEDAFDRATVFVAPHRFAAGVQNKVVHALATGTPVVSTPAVRDGLMPVPEGVMRVGESADEIAGHVIELIRDPAGAAALAERGRAWATATFTWDVALEALETSAPTRDRQGTASLLVAGV
ncbi:MAG TPA: glycosyltransferase family 4 protein [Candidatus Eisenbacteria bacterium]|nr:glycosyltransferase family 4 protein [Candidatus Eisenbacteria bacterium]